MMPPHRALVLLAAALLGGGAVSEARAETEKVRIEGLRTVSPEQAQTWLASHLEYVESAGVTSARADDLAFFLESAMRQQGYSKATVTWKVVGHGESAIAVLTASEGNSVLLGTISVEGNSALEDEAVVELMTAATRKRLKAGDDDPLPYVKEDLRKGQARVLSFYQLMGYRNAQVDLESNDTGGVTNLHLRIEEGADSKIGQVALPPPPSPALAPAFDKIRADFAGMTYTGAASDNLASRVRAVAVEAGWYHAKVEALESDGGQSAGVALVDLAVVADWGTAVTITDVRVSGNEKVKTEFFERHFADLERVPYSPNEMNEAVNELLETGMFETVRAEITAREDGSHQLDVEVEEGYSRTLGVYGGFTNYEGPIGGFEFANLNLFGMVRKLDAAIEFSQRGARGEINYTDPWFLDTDFGFSGGLFALNRDEEGYEKFQTGGRYEFSRRFGREKKDSIALFGEAAYTDVHEAEIAPVFLGDREYFSHQLGLSLTHDRRDNPRKPRKGYLAQTSLSAASSALGSEVEYWKATGRLGYYLPVGEHTLRLGARAGLISWDDEIPIDLRFFNGGPFSVRSFQERSLGLRDPASGYAVGGNFYTVFNAEYEIPLSRLSGLSVVPFADAGNLLFDDSHASLDDLRYAVGLGLRYETPIGPIRLEYGLNPDQRPGEPEGTFHLGFGLGY